MPERVPKIVNSNHLQPGSFPCELPSPIVNALRRVATIGEDELGVFTPLFVDDRAGNRIEHHNPFLTVLGLKLVVNWKDEHTRIQFRNLNLPIPTQLQNFLLATAGIYFEERDPLQMRRQFSEQAILLLPTQWIRLTFGALLHFDQRRSIKPRHTIVVPPDSGRQIQNPTNTAEFFVDRAG